MPIAPWNASISATDASFGVRTSQFGFNVAWASRQEVVVEACTNLVKPLWQALQTNTFTGGPLRFSDPQWANFPGRFYRLRLP